MPSSPVNARQAAELTGVSERTIRRWIKTGRLPARKEGRDFQIDYADLRVAARVGLFLSAEQVKKLREMLVPLRDAHESLSRGAYTEERSKRRLKEINEVLALLDGERS